MSKKKRKTRLLKERMRQFSIWFFENEDQKELEHARRRLERKKKKKMASRGMENKFLQFLYGFDVILWIIGIVFTLCSSIKTFGKHTAFYRFKSLFLLLGPALLFAAVLVLFLATGLKHRMRIKHAKPQRSFYIMQKKKKESKSEITKDPDNDSGNEEDIEMSDLNKKKVKTFECEDQKENLAIARRLVRADSHLSDDYSFECSKLVEQPEAELDGNRLKRAKARRAWAKTKWMRVGAESDDDVELGDTLDLTSFSPDPSGEDKLGHGKHSASDKFPKSSGKGRITRFKPLSGSCITAQASIKSHASEASYVSTTSESAPLFRK